MLTADSLDGTNGTRNGCCVFSVYFVSRFARSVFRVKPDGTNGTQLREVRVDYFRRFLLDCFLRALPC